MAGTLLGGRATAKTNKLRYGSDFYQKIGAKGGKLSRNGGFGQGEAGRKRAAVYGAIGGRHSRRSKSRQ